LSSDKLSTKENKPHQEPAASQEMLHTKIARQITQIAITSRSAAHDRQELNSNYAKCPAIKDEQPRRVNGTLSRE
jgi:hypothetical protein